MSDICKDDVRLQTAGLPAALLSDARRVDALSIELELETLHLRVLMFVFFFSSRRRHTRWPRDWSSDVCSSDLQWVEKYFGRLKRGPQVPKISATTPPITAERRAVVTDQVELPRVYMGWITSPIRSEERRVGKECRSRWWGD